MRRQSTIQRGNRRKARAWRQLTAACCLTLWTGSSAFAGSGDMSDSELRDAVARAARSTPSFSDNYEAEIWLRDMARRLENKIKDPKDRVKFLSQVHYEARLANLPPELVLAVIEIESNFNRWAISKAGAQGLMQVMPFWLEQIGRPRDNLFHPETNLRLGCTILRFYIDKERGNLIRALGRYNGSLGSFDYPNLVLTALRKRWYRP